MHTDIRIAMMPSKFQQIVNRRLTLEEMDDTVRTAKGIRERTLRARAELERGDTAAYHSIKVTAPVVAPAWCAPPGTRAAGASDGHNGLYGFDADRTDGDNPDSPDFPLEWAARVWSELVEWGRCLFIAPSMSGRFWFVLRGEPVPGHLYSAAWTRIRNTMIPPEVRRYTAASSSNLNRLRFLAYGETHLDWGVPIFRVDTERLEPVKAEKPARAAAPMMENGLTPIGVGPRPRSGNGMRGLLPWVGEDATLTAALSRLENAMRCGKKVIATCPAHTGSESIHHLQLSRTDGRKVLVHCFSDHCSADYATLAASVEDTIGCRLSA